MTNIKQKVLTYKDWYRDDIHFGYIFNVTHFNDKSWIIKIDAVPSTHKYYYGTFSWSGKSYMYYQYNGYITMLNILHTAFNLDVEEYGNILNLINSNDDANIEIAGAMLRNLHRNYNITKKTDNEIRSDSDK